MNVVIRINFCEIADKGFNIGLFNADIRNFPSEIQIVHLEMDFSCFFFQINPLWIIHQI